jgi:hypothetical protein
MRIWNIRIDPVNDRCRLAATIRWEDCERTEQEIYFEVDAAFTPALAHSPDPFLAATLTPALWAGERRIAMSEDICPEMLDNLRVSVQAFRHWFKLDQKIAIEAKPRARRHAAAERRAGFFFSGGVDSLSSLRANRLNFPLQHPGSLKDGIIVYGLEVEDPTAFGHVLGSLEKMASDAQITLLSVATNIRDLNPDWVFWYNAYMGPALCAVAQALSGRLASVIIASDYDVPHLTPHGSHPLVEPYFSSSELKVRYDGMTRTRLEKTKLVADWPLGLQYLRVCNKPELYQPGRLNCGECEKCIRTMLALLALGSLDKTSAFPRRDLSAEFIEQKVALHHKILPFYKELIPALAQNGRSDLSQAIQQLWRRYHGEDGWKGRLRRFDRERLHGTLRSLKRTFTPNSEKNGS